MPRTIPSIGASATLLESTTRAADSPAVRSAERAAAVAFVTVLTIVAAQVSVPLPFTPVPFTFQPMIVLLGGAALGARLGMTSQVLYLALGLAGLPVFAASPLPQGAARILGPTGGYLLSYPLAACVAGWLAGRGLDRRYLGTVAAMGAGLVVVFAGGVAWLALFAGRGFGGALSAGFYPFVLADCLKLLAAAGVMPGLWWLTGRRAS